MKKFLLPAAAVLVLSLVLAFLVSPSKVTPPVSVRKSVKIGILSQKTNRTYETSVRAMKEELARRGYAPLYLQEEVSDPNEFRNVSRRYVSAPVDVIVANSTPATKAALEASISVPIVFGSVGDPVANNIVASLDSSNNNSTGVSSLSVQLTPTRLETLKKYLPDLKHVFFIHQPGEVASDNSRQLLSKEAVQSGIQLIEKPVANAAEVKSVALGLRRSEAEAIIMAASGMIWTNVGSLIAAQNREAVPLVGVDRTMAESGAAFSYGPDYRIVGQQVAGLIDQVLRGVKPRYLPIQRPKKIELVVNEKVAGVVLKPRLSRLLKEADEVLP